MPATQRPVSDDPRKLRALLARSLQLASDHGLPSAIVGLAGREDDALVPDLFRFLESTLRVEDAIFHMTRERAVLFLADVGAEKAREIVERAIAGFRREFPRALEAPVTAGYFELQPADHATQLRDVLPSIFPSERPAAI